MGYLTRKDTEIFRKFFVEAAYLRGITVRYSYPITVNTTIYTEFKTEMSTPEEMDVIFIENPKPTTLKKFGWVSVDPKDKPYIVQLPFSAKNLCTLCELDINPIDVLGDMPKKFRINDIKTLLEYPDCWTCLLAPIFDSDPEKDNYDQTNYNHLKTSQDPNEDSPANVAFKKIDSNYTYIDTGGT